MAKYGKQLYISFLVWDTENNAPRTGDAGNLLIWLVKDGSSPITPAHAPTEINSDFMPGIYRMLLNDLNMMADTIAVSGTSSTPNTVVYPTFIETHNEVDANIVKVKNSPVDSVNDFKANLTGVAQETTVSAVQTSINNLNDFDPATEEVNANIVKVNSNPVASTNDFKATVTGLAQEATSLAIKAETDKIDNLALESTLGGVDDKINALTEVDGDDLKFTEKALEDSPVADISGVALQASVDNLPSASEISTEIFSNTIDGKTFENILKIIKSALSNKMVEEVDGDDKILKFYDGVGADVIFQVRVTDTKRSPENIG